MERYAGRETGNFICVFRGDHKKFKSGSIPETAYGKKRKTGSDYSRVRDVTLKVDTEEAFNAVAAFSLSNLLMVLPVAVVVIVILDERKKGLWEFVHVA